MNWKEKGGYLQKKFKFKNWSDAVDFVNKISKISEEVDHHPDILLKWGVVVVRLKTHDKDSITQKDHELAKLISAEQDPG